VIRAADVTTLPTTIATFIPATPEVAANLSLEPTGITTSPGTDWHACAFRVRWNGGAMVMLAATEQSGVAPRDTAAPPHRWGTADLQTDARVAVFIDYAAGRSEAILINGAFIGAQPAPTLVALPHRVPLLRLASTILAPTMHGQDTGSNLSVPEPIGD
jgi:hypothetical protein